MKKPIVVVLLAVLVPLQIPATAGTPLQIEEDPKGQKVQKRQSISYSNNIIHQDPRYPESTAESNVEVSFNHDPNSKFHSNSNSHQHRQQPSYTMYKKRTNPRQIDTIHPHHPEPPSQSFNVGYSVRFGSTNPNTGSKPIEFQYNKKSYQHSEESSIGTDDDIITGVPKLNQEVQKPKFQPTLFDTAPVKKTTNFHQQQQYHQKPPKDLWKYHPQHNQQYQKKFDHAKVLGRMQRFDYTNALGISEQRADIGGSGPTLFYSSKKKKKVQPVVPQVEETHQSSIENDDNTSSILQFEPNEDEYLVPSTVKPTHLYESKKKYQKFNGNGGKYFYGRLPQFVPGKGYATIGGDFSKRQPRFVGDYLQTNLRPPPYIGVVRQRRTYYG